MKMRVWICSLISVFIVTVGCSDNYDLMQEEQQQVDREVVDNNLYYYDGVIALENGDDGKTVYVIKGPMLRFPREAEDYIPIPLLEYHTTSVVEIDLGDNTLIEDKSVIFTHDGVERIENLPESGDRIFSDGLSIQRVSKEVIRVSMCGYFDGSVKILTKPNPIDVFDNNKNRFVRHFNSGDYNLNDTVPLVLTPNMFLDRYRPIRQDRMYVY